MKRPAEILDSLIESVDVWSSRASVSLHRVAVNVALPLLTAVVMLDVILRYVFSAPLQGGRDINGLLLLITFFSALPHAWDNGHHIRMEILYGRLRGRARELANAAAAVSGILFFGLMGVQAFRFVAYMAPTGETGVDLTLPVWPFMAYMGFCSLVLTARLLANPVGKAEDHGAEIMAKGAR